MGWNEFWDWALSDSDESYYEHLKKDYGEDAPIIHAILDTAADTVVGAIPGVGVAYTIANTQTPAIKETKDVLWEDRHEILGVGSAVPIVGTAVSAIDATLHAAESVENDVEFFVEGATGEDEPIYDENGNIIGWRDKWMTEEMQRKKNYAVSHGVNATVGAVLTLTGGNYFKGGKAAVEAAKKGGGNVVERFLVKNADEAAKAAEDTARMTKNIAAEGAEQVSKAEIVAAEKKAAAEAAERTAQQATENATIKRAEAKAAAEAAAEEGAKKSAKRNASKKAQQASNAEGHAAAKQANADAAKTASAEADATLKQVTDNAAARNQAANYKNNKAQRRYQMGLNAINFLESSNNIRSFLTTSVSVGLAEVSIYNKNIDRMGVSDKYKAPTIPYVNE